MIDLRPSRPSTPVGMGLALAGRRLLMGGGGAPPTYNNLRLLGAAIFTLVSDFDEEEE